MQYSNELWHTCGGVQLPVASDEWLASITEWKGRNKYIFFNSGSEFLNKISFQDFSFNCGVQGIQYNLTKRQHFGYGTTHNIEKIHYQLS